MARTFVLLLLGALALAHGGSARSQPGQGGTQITIVPTGGSGRPDVGPEGGPSTESNRGRRHTWEIWWSYNREYYLAQRARGAVVTGVRALDDKKQRADLREGRLIDLLLEALEDVKGRDIVVFNVARHASIFERVVIASGDSTRQVNALAGSVQQRAKAIGARVYGVEGRRNGEWVLVDLGDIVVHIMHPAVRSHYNLEELWGGKEVKLKRAAEALRAPHGKAARRRARR